MSTSKDRILQWLDLKGIKAREFYRKTGLSNGFLNAGKNIGDNNLRTIIEAYPELSLEWVVFGTGNMEINIYNLESSQPSDLEDELVKYKADANDYKVAYQALNETLKDLKEIIEYQKDIMNNYKEELERCRKNKK